MWAQQQQQDESQASSSAPAHQLETVKVTGAAEEEKKAIGNTTGASKKDIERRNASHMTDLIQQISGMSMNSLYANPEVSVGVQGIAGHGRVSQQLEGISQNFHAFTRDIGQTGSIFVEPQFLGGIEVTRGGGTGTSALGSLGSSVNFRYLDLNDILRPGKDFGGMVRLRTGFSQYRNGEKPSGSAFLGGRTERWEWMVGYAHSENDTYRIGRNSSKSDMMRDAYAKNMTFKGNFHDAYQGVTCRYCAGGIGGMGSAIGDHKFTGPQRDWLTEAARDPLPGSQKKTDAQMLRLRHYFDDPYNQRLELFATASSAKYETDQQPAIYVPLAGEADSRSRWYDYPWSVRAELESQVISLKYAGNFSDYINSDVQVYYEDQDRKQRWKGYPGTYSMGQDLHYFTDVGSKGIKLSNASHFDAAWVGPLRLDAELDLRREDKKVDSLSDSEFYQQHMHSIGLTHYKSPVWDPDSKTNMLGLALALSTEGDGPWQASAGVGYQRVKLDVLNPRFYSGNVKKSGLMYGAGYWRQQYIAQGIPRRQALQMAIKKAAEQAAEFYIEPGALTNDRLVEDEQNHEWNLKSAHFALQYTRPGTGLTTYASASYSERAPTSNEMYMGGPWLKTGFASNPDLKPEKNLSLQLGVNYAREDWLASKDRFNVGVNYYHNHIRNYIAYGPIVRPNMVGDGTYLGGLVASINNLNAFVRHGLELNLSYSQPLFQVLANFTLPLRHDNKICSYESPSGDSYHVIYNPDGSTEFIPYGSKGDRNCYSSWNWMEVGNIGPIRGSLTAAVTPMQGRLEVGATMHFRGKQRAVFWYDPDLASNRIVQQRSTETLPDHADFITASIWPKMLKFDLFANYRVNDQLKVGVYLANLTDQMDATTTTFGYNFYPGRTLTANLEYRF